MKLMGGLVALGVLLAAASSGFATPEFILLGEPEEGGSWSQNFWLTGAQNATVVQAWVEGWTFDSTEEVGFSAFMTLGGTPVPGWSQTYITPDWTMAVAGGPALSSTDKKFRLTFEGNKHDAPDFILHLQAYAGDTYLAGSTFSWDADLNYNPAQPWMPYGGWSPNNEGRGTADTWDARSVVPEPLTATGLLLGIGCLGRYLARRRREG